VDKREILGPFSKRQEHKAPTRADAPPQNRRGTGDGAAMDRRGTGDGPARNRRRTGDEPEKEGGLGLYREDGREK
jgi:hypothetical protein